MFALSSDIAIGSFRFSGCHEVRIVKSLHGVVEKAVVKIPSIARIIRNGKATPGPVITGKQFSDGDKVIVKLGYDSGSGASSALQTEFTGFVKSRNLNMPLEVECEGYSYLLRRNSITGYWNKITVKDLLQVAVSGIDSDYNINVLCDLDISLNHVVINHLCGLEIINEILRYTDGALSCCFTTEGNLWCGFVYTPCAEGKSPFGKAAATLPKYRLGYNAIKDNLLKGRFEIDDPVEVIYQKRFSAGGVVRASSDVFSNAVRTHTKVLNHIADENSLKMLAKEKAYSLNYAGYEGVLSGFLQPFVSVGDSIYIEDNRYEERKGNFLVESLEIVYGTGGARRYVEVGSQIS